MLVLRRVRAHRILLINQFLLTEQVGKSLCMHKLEANVIHINKNYILLLHSQ